VGNTATNAPRRMRGVAGLATQRNTCFKSLLASPAAPTKAKTRTRHAATSAGDEEAEEVGAPRAAALLVEGQAGEAARELAAAADDALPAVVAAAGGVVTSLPAGGLPDMAEGESLLAPC